MDGGVLVRGCWAEEEEDDDDDDDDDDDADDDKCTVEFTGAGVFVGVFIEFRRCACVVEGRPTPPPLRVDKRCCFLKQIYT